jgi:sugar lactone lactonase YvrE
MDHSIANVRRYPEVKLYRDETNVLGHAGMVVHPTKRILYIANPGKGTIVAVNIDTGKYSRTAREEYPIFSNKLPSFEYSIYECVDQDENFVSGLSYPTGLALSSDGARLFVAERTGRILAFDVESGMLMQSIDIPTYTSIGGLAEHYTSRT